MTTASPEEPALPDGDFDSRTAEAHRSQAEGRIFPCEACGADVVFHIGTQQLKCPYCGHTQALALSETELQERDYEAQLKSLREHHETLDFETGLKEVRCDSCGGTVVFEGNLASTDCPYCTSPIQLEHVHEVETRIRPDGVLPFLVDEKRARKSLRDWVHGLWFAPSDFRQADMSGRFSGVYLPFWTFDSMTYTVYSGQRGETYTVRVGTGKNRRTETRVRWYPAAGDFQRFFDDVLVIACREMSPDLIAGMEPWPLQKAIPFNREVLAGYLARTYDTELEAGFREARPRIERALESDVRRRIGGDRQRVHKMDVGYSAVTFKYMFLPVWLLSYKYKGKVYQVMINAATGRVSGQRPWSMVKIILTALLGLFVVLTLWGLLSIFAG